MNMINAFHILRAPANPSKRLERGLGDDDDDDYDDDDDEEEEEEERQRWKFVDKL